MAPISRRQPAVVYWLGELAHGNLGQSIFLQRPVTQALLERAEPTFFLTLFSIVIATLIGVPCGIIAAVWRGRTIDQFFSGFAMLGASIPSFWFGLILMQIFAVGLGWFPVAGYGNPGVPLSSGCIIWCCRRSCSAWSTRR